MLGLKIMSKSDYNCLIKHLGENLDKITELLSRIDKLDYECKSLREQNGELRQKINSLGHSKNDKIEGVTGLKDYTVLRTGTYPCDKCNIESEHCKKLSFADTTICVCKQDKVNRFTKGKKK